MRIHTQYITNSRIFIGLLILLFSLQGCKSSEAELLSYDLPDHNATTILDYSENSITINFPEELRSANDFVADFLLSEGAEAFVDEKLQTSGHSENNYEKPFAFQIVSEDGKNSAEWMVNSVNSDICSRYGLGGFLQEEKSHNREYPWYINQSETGIFSDYNCAPTSIVMCGLWCNENFPYSVIDARSMYQPNGGGWYSSDIDNCLNDFKIQHAIIPLSNISSESTEIIKEQIDNGNLIILCVDVHYLRLCENDSVHCDKYYRTIKLGTGHCIVLKGYKKVDGQLFFEAYDPSGYSFCYKDGTSKGINRYYRSEDVYTATFAYWNYVFVISDSNSIPPAKKSLKASEIPDVQVF